MEKNTNLYSLKKVFKGASIYSIGEVLVKASGFFLIPIYTRVLTPNDYGIVGYLQVFLKILTVLVAFGFHGAQTRFYYENNKDSSALGKFAFTINLLPISFAILIVVPLTVIGFFYNWEIGSENIPFSPFMVLTLWTVVFQVMANNAVSWFKARQQFVTVSVLQVSRFLSITGFSLLLVLGFDMKAIGRVAGMFIGMLVFIVISFGGYARFFVWKPSKDALIYAFSFGAPLVIHLLAATLHNTIDRIILDNFVSLDKLGIYTIAFTIGNALNMLIIAFNQAYQPNYFQLMSSERKDKEHQIIRVFKLWLLVITIITTTGIIFGGPFLKVFAGTRFIATMEIFPWILLAIFMGGFYFFFSAPIFFFKKTKYLPLITGISSVINIALNYCFIPFWGILGAAIATIISHIVQSVMALVIGNRLYGIRWPLLNIGSSILIVLSSVIVVTVY